MLNQEMQRDVVSVSNQKYPQTRASEKCSSERLHSSQNSHGDGAVHTDSRNALELSPFGFARSEFFPGTDTTPPDFRIIDANPAFARILGLAQEQLIDTMASDITDSDCIRHFQRWDMYLRVIHEGEPAAFSFPCPRRNKTYEVRVQPDQGRFLLFWIAETVEMLEKPDIKDVCSLYKDMLQNLEKTRERYMLAAKGSNDGMWDWNLVDGSLFLSPKWKEQLGYADDELRNAFSTFESLLHPEDKPRAMEYVQQYLKGSIEVYDIEIRLRHKNGTYRWIRARGEALRDESGAPYRMAGSHTDITETRAAEKALSEAEDKFRTIFNDSPLPISLTLAEDGTFVEVNDIFCTYSQYSREEIVGKNSLELDLFSDEDRRLIMSYIRQKGFVRDLEMDFRIRDGSTFSTIMFSRLIDIDNKQYLLSTLYNITERKQAERALKESEEKFRTFVENAGDIIYSLTPDGRFSYVSPNWTEYLGHTPEEVAGKHFNQFVYPDDVKACDEFLQSILAGNKNKDGVDYRVIDKNGGIHRHFSNGALLRDEDGAPKSFIAVARDITERKKAEQQLLETNLHLEEMTTRANEMAAQAEMANAAKSEFVANMSHEIRTPMNAVLGFTDLLLSTNLTPEQREYAQNSASSAHSLMDIINDVLDFSKIEAGKIELEELKTDLIELMETTADMVKYSTSQKGLELLLDIPPDLPRFITVDPIRLKQILTNLLSNSVKFTESGEVELSVVFTPSRSDGLGSFTFSVRDTGIGISHKNRSRLFKAFSQGDTSTTRKFGGTGLGLVISNRLAEKMGGRIEVESTPGAGSRFTFTLNKPFENGQSIFEKVPIAGTGRVLVVDDNAGNRLILQRTLSQWDIQTVSAANGIDALEKIRGAGRFDLVLTDLHMPFMDGIEMVDKIRNDLCLSSEEQPVVLLHSSGDDNEIQHKCRELGIANRMVKPVKNRDLRNAILNRRPVPIQDPPIDSPREALESNGGHTEGSGAATILIAEDARLNMVLLRTLLKKLAPSSTVLEAADGRAAVRIYREYFPTLILMDVQMPEMNGYAATKAIRRIEEEGGNRSEIVALTAGVVKGERERCLEAGMDDYLTKPIDVEALAEVLKRHSPKSNGES